MSRGGGEGGSHQWELVGHAPVGGDLGTEAERREHLVAVVVLDDLTHCPQRHGVGVELVGAQVVQGGGLRWVACSRGFGGGSVCGVVAHPPPRAQPQGGSCPLPALTIGRSEVDGHREIDLGPGREKNPSEDGEMEEELHCPPRRRCAPAHGSHSWSPPRATITSCAPAWTRASRLTRPGCSPGTCGQTPQRRTAGSPVGTAG